MHKYTNTVLVKVAYRHDMCYIFEKVMVRGPQRQCSQVSDLQIHKYTNTALVKYVLKYTNTNTTSVKVADMPNMLYFLKGNKAEAHKFQDGKRRIRTVYFV